MRPFHPLLALLAANSLAAQYSATVSSLARRTEHVVWFGRSGDQSLSIEYGQPKWRAPHESVLKAGVAQDFFLGSGTWSVLQSDVDLDFGGQILPRGRWYLGLHRDEAEVWTLTMTAPDKIAAANRSGGRNRGVEPQVRAPMRFSREDETVEALTITVAVDRRIKKNVALTIAWGPFRLHGDFIAAVDDRLAEGAPAFAPTPEAKRITTASGLRYEQLRAGAGAFPQPDSTVLVHYTGWLEDGTPFDSSYLRGQPTKLEVQHVVKGFGEGLQLMQPGATFQFTIPPALGYGAKGAGQEIPPDATLVFQVTLVSIEN